MTWCAERGIALRSIQPGKPAHNGFIERFNRTYRTDVLNAYVFESLDQVRESSAAWLLSDNEERPHDALAGGRLLRIGANLRPEILFCHCLLDGGAYKVPCSVQVFVVSAAGFSIRF